AKQVVGGIVDTYKGPRQSTDAAGQANAVLALFLNFESQINSGILLVQSSFGDIGIIGLQLIEKSKLVETQETKLPGTVVVNLAFFQRQFATNHFVTRGGVALELDAPHMKLLAFINIDGQGDRLFFFVKFRVRHG